jgi:DNA invertase Pin-like site-specific DNA recombinase
MATQIERTSDWKVSAIAYIRESTDKRTLGMDAQRDAIRRALDGNEPVAEYSDRLSGKDEERPGLKAALLACKRLGATLIVAKLDRLSRRVHFISGLIEQGYDFRCADMPTKGRFMLHIYAAFAEEERRRISERTKAALQSAKARGKKLGSAANPAHGARLAAHNRSKAIEAAEMLRPRIEALQEAGIDRQSEIAKALGMHVTQVARVMRRLHSLSAEEQAAEVQDTQVEQQTAAVEA